MGLHSYEFITMSLPLPDLTLQIMDIIHSFKLHVGTYFHFVISS